MHVHSISTSARMCFSASTPRIACGNSVLWPTLTGHLAQSPVVSITGRRMTPSVPVLAEKPTRSIGDPQSAEPPPLRKRCWGIGPDRKLISMSGIRAFSQYARRLTPIPTVAENWSACVVTTGRHAPERVDEFVGTRTPRGAVRVRSRETSRTLGRTPPISSVPNYPMAVQSQARLVWEFARPPGARLVLRSAVLWR